MSAVKTNERPGTRAQIKYVRSSASKAREVLNLIRQKSFQDATDLLVFSERRISDTIHKCLNSAAANAENNDGISSEELYVTACYADEGPTLKRWRPRARGRATRIRKRTCGVIGSKWYSRTAFARNSRNHQPRTRAQEFDDLSSETATSTRRHRRCR